MKAIIIERTTRNKYNKSMFVNDVHLRLLSFVNTDKDIRHSNMSNKEIGDCLDYFNSHGYFLSITDNKLVTKKSQIKFYYHFGFDFYQPITTQE